MNYPNNAEFLSALFGEDVPWVHVTDFTYDPGHIPKDRHLAAWAGDYFSRYQFKPGSNQYFTISNFYSDQLGKARRRKALYRHTRVIVLDDVKEKLSMDQVSKMPSPSWILETSPGSEQWGYILDQLCADRSKVENLLDGLVANGLAPDGRDPGMKGVTRYVRLPDGYNNKSSKLVNGLPFKCRLLLWQPWNRVSIEALAKPFAVDLNAPRRETRIDGASAIDDHPLLNVPDIIHIKEVRSDGRFDVTCPWVDEHTGHDDSGAGVFTNGDGTIGFKCHHGACQHRTGRHLLQFVETAVPGFGASFNNWKVIRSLTAVSNISFMTPAVKPKPVISFMETPVKSTVSVSFLTTVANTNTPPVAPPPLQQQPVADGLEILTDALRRERPTSGEARQLATQILKHVDGLPKIEQKHWHDTVCDLMTWAKTDLKEILKDLRQQWYGEKVSAADFYDKVMFVKELNQFYDWQCRIFFSTDAFQNSYSHEEAEAKKIALQDGRVRKVDRLDYAPKMPRVFVDRGTTYGNTYVEDNSVAGEFGDASNWLNHFDFMGWGENRKHVLQWMAFTILHPETKINHMLMLGSGEGSGKDFLLYPLMKAMGDNGSVIAGEDLLSDYNDYLLSTKYLLINETELGDRKEATAISNKLKPIAAAPPDILRVNQKHVKQIKIRNIVSAVMTTNSQTPVRLNGPSRRMYCLWSDLNPRDAYDNMTPAWQTYWDKMWQWMKFEGGYQYCIYYLRNCVDLRDFNPGAAPPVTEFLREIKEASKSPAIQTLENFIRKQIGVFKCDIMRSDDIVETMRAGALMAQTDMYVDSKIFTRTRVGQLMSEIQSCLKLRAFYLGDSVRLWAVRNPERYQHMDATMLYQEYERQMKAARASVVLTVVK